MTAAADHKFGGPWTRTKLACVAEYLKAYTTALKNQPFRLLYIDGFAGTGSWNPSKSKKREEARLPGMEDKEAREFARGSARIALETDPPFAEYRLIEKSKKRCVELASLADEYPAVRSRVSVVCSEANEYVRQLCQPGGIDWRFTRAVLFLDPYGMQVDWDTIEAVAGTKSIDLWLLFPLGTGVMRLLRGDGAISEPRLAALSRLFGCDNWRDEFYARKATPGLFGPMRSVAKEADFGAIEDFWLRRLRSVFPAVSGKPLQLRNSKGNPMYLLCFASGNKKGAPLALRIADHILKGMRNG